MENKKETFQQLIQRLSELYGLDWMDMVTCPDKGTALCALERHRTSMMETREYSLAVYAENAIAEIDEFYDILPWQPTEQDYRECCGVWVDELGIGTRVVPEFKELGGGLAITDFASKESFFSFAEDKCLARLEPIPEQCIPKDDPPSESYQLKYPLLAGVIE